MIARDADDTSRPPAGASIERCEAVDHAGWLALREALWPDASRDAHLVEMASFVDEPERYVQFVATASDGEPIGLAEASLRSDYVNGTAASPVAFLEGLFVAPAHRRTGVAAALVARVASWGRDRGCRELASDTPIENETSRAVHAALGFTETERVIFFSKRLS